MLLDLLNALFCRTIDPKPCNPRTLQKPKKGGGYPKVFLGGLPSNVTETDLRTFFTRFGKVMEVVIMYDQEKKKSRGISRNCNKVVLRFKTWFFSTSGFGFLSFEDEDAVDRCVAEHFVNLNGKQVSKFADSEYCLTLISSMEYSRLQWCNRIVYEKLQQLFFMCRLKSKRQNQGTALAATRWVALMRHPLGARLKLPWA